jgi:aldose 1-epimerase
VSAAGGSRGGAVRREPFGAAPDGAPVELFTFANAAGTEVRVMTWGAIIVSLRTRDRRGALGDIVLGHDDAAEYARSDAYFGAVVGRYGNRIADGRFRLDGASYQLTVNDGANHLHGGTRGFDKVHWRPEPFAYDDERGVTLFHRSPDGDQGYPGTLDARVTYTLTDGDTLVIDYEAKPDRATPVNLTQHSYFNLAGAGSGDVLAHDLTIHADRYTPVNAGLIPTGELALVADTPFDFRTPTPIGARVDADHPQLRIAGGYDHNFVLRRGAGTDGDGGLLVHAARLSEPTSGRMLDVLTTEPGLQFYSGNFLDGTVRGKDGRVYPHRGGLCLETQHFPDSPNQPQFPSTVVHAGRSYLSRTVFAFGVQDATA